MKVLTWLKRIDGRYFLFGSHITLFMVGYFFYGLQRTWLQFASAYVVAIAVELILHFTMQKYPHASVNDRVLSAASEAAGLLLLLHSRVPQLHCLVAGVAVASKYFFTRPDGKHIFNPTNFGIVFGLTFLPAEWINIHPDEFSLEAYPILHVIAFGTFAIILGRAYWVTIGYFLTLLLCAGAAQIFNEMGFLESIAPSLGAFGMIFAFLMVTDPKTTPKIGWQKACFGSAVALTMLILRYYQVCFESFIALFIISLGRHSLLLLQPRMWWLQKAKAFLAAREPQTAEIT